jgi:hypothetical protein
MIPMNHGLYVSVCYYSGLDMLMSSSVEDCAVPDAHADRVCNLLRRIVSIYCLKLANHEPV